MRPVVLIAIAATGLYCFVMFRLAKHRKRWGVFMTRGDLVDSENYDAGGRRWIAWALVTAIAAVVSWVAVFSST